MSKVAATESQLMSMLEAVKSGLGGWLCAVEGGWHRSIKVHGRKVHGLRMSWFGSHGQPSFFFLLLFRLGAGAKAKEKEGKGNPRKEQGETAESWEQVIAKRKGKEEEGQC